MTALLSVGESWRVAALTMMGQDALSAALTGENAAQWVAAAAACGIAEARLRLGRMLLEGEGLAKNQASAVRQFQAAAADGSIEAHNMLGRCLENGWGVEAEPVEAARHYRIAAEAGLDWAQYNLGHMLLSGSGVTRDLDAAFFWYGKAAGQGHARAMSLLGRCHENGWGCGRDRRLALLWYRRSARGGYFRGAFNYASLLLEKNCAQSARRWYARALDTAPEPARSNMIAAWQLQEKRSNRVPATLASCTSSLRLSGKPPP
jgi:TPR repeat protein